MSNEFKGVPGGDPSRRPKLVLTTFNCDVCTAPYEELWNGKATVSPYCSEPCRNERRKELHAKNLEKHGLFLTSPLQRGLGSLESMSKVYDMVQSLKRNIHIYVNTDNKCETCHDTFTQYSPEPIKTKRTFCSDTCRRNRNVVIDRASFNKETLCPRPEKVKYLSREAVEDKLVSLEGVEGVHDKDAVSYLCNCLSWHYGSHQKKVFQDEEIEIMETKYAELEKLIVSNSFYVVLNGQRKKKAKKKRPRQMIAA